MGVLSGEGETADASLSRAVIVASFGSLLLNLGSTSINVAIDRLMEHFRADGAADRRRVPAVARTGAAVVSLDGRAARLAAALRRLPARLHGDIRTLRLCVVDGELDLRSRSPIIASLVLRGAGLGATAAPAMSAASLANAFAHTFAVSAALSALALFAGLVLARPLHRAPTEGETE